MQIIINLFYLSVFIYLSPIEARRENNEVVCPILTLALVILFFGTFRKQTKLILKNTTESFFQRKELFIRQHVLRKPKRHDATKKATLARLNVW